MPAALGQTLSAEERKWVLEMLDHNSRRFLDDIRPLTVDQWNFKPAPGTWSVAEIAEHIYRAEGLLRSIAQKSLQSKAEPEKAAALQGKESAMISLSENQDVKADAPEVLYPTGAFATKELLKAAFQQVRADTRAYVASTNDSLKVHVAYHPQFKDLTAYQWLVWIAAHANRHTAQIEAVMARDTFPRK
jgi:uncharacterized damage-inducible protein DinB